MNINRDKARKYMAAVCDTAANVVAETNSHFEKYPNGIFRDVLDDILDFLGAGNSPDDARRDAVIGDVEDADDTKPVSLQEHDDARHGGRFDPDTMSCKLRDEMGSKDPEDRMRQDAVAQCPDTKNPVTAGTDKWHSIPGLSNRKAKEYRDLMARKHPDVDAEKLLTELGKIGDRKVQGDAFRWAMKGAELPRDVETITKARQMADKAKVDPLSYDSPQGCVDALSGNIELKEKPIDPDTVPELSDKKVLPMGVTTYLVQDDRQGQQAMRRILNTHWGKDANPWCLLHGDGEGNLSDGENDGYNAWYYWEHYNALPKRVAFKDGKLLAFMATDKGDPLAIGETISVEQDDIRVYTNLDPYKISSDYYFRGNEESSLDYDEWFKKNYPIEYEYIYDRKRDYLNKRLPKEQWWDRQDASHEGIPLGNIPVPGDAFGRWADFEIRDGKPVKVGEYRKGRSCESGSIEWHDNGNVRTIQDGDMTYGWNSEGQFVMCSKPGLFGDRHLFNDDGSYRGHWNNGVRINESVDEDGVRKIREKAEELRRRVA